MLRQWSSNKLRGPPNTLDAPSEFLMCGTPHATLALPFCSHALAAVHADRERARMRAHVNATRARVLANFFLHLEHFVLGAYAQTTLTPARPPVAPYCFAARRARLRQRADAHGVRC